MSSNDNSIIEAGIFYNNCLEPCTCVWGCNMPFVCSVEAQLRNIIRQLRINDLNEMVLLGQGICYNCLTKQYTNKQGVIEPHVCNAC